MHVVALLPRSLLGHLRFVLGDLHTLHAATDAAELHTLLRTGDAELLVVDPALDGGAQAAQLEESIASHPSLPVVVYTTLSPVAMRQVPRLARLGVQHVVLNRFDDEPRRFLELLERVPASPLGELMLHELAGALRSMPVTLARAVEQLYRSPARVKSSRELAALAGMSPRTLYRHLTPLGLGPRQLIVSARLLRAYAFLHGSGDRLKEVALKLGYPDPSQLGAQLREWSGCGARELRREVPPELFVRRVAERLWRAGEIGVDVTESV